jgi:hypothetical protein
VRRELADAEATTADLRADLGRAAGERDAARQQADEFRAELADQAKAGALVQAQLATETTQRAAAEQARDLFQQLAEERAAHVERLVAEAEGLRRQLEHAQADAAPAPKPAAAKPAKKAAASKPERQQ